MDGLTNEEPYYSPDEEAAFALDQFESEWA